MKTNSLLSPAWEKALSREIKLDEFYSSYHKFIQEFEEIIPSEELIFHVFQRLEPDQVKCVVFGEDPYPRKSSAQGIAFWDAEIDEWSTKSRGNSLKHLMKALMVYQGKATYQTSLDECQALIQSEFKTPAAMFEQWLDQGIFLLNTALTFTGAADKKAHFAFWQPFIEAVIRVVNHNKPYFILWGRKAQNWESFIIASGGNTNRIVKQPHPTYIHQFLSREDINYSPFTEIIETTGLKWI